MGQTYQPLDEADILENIELYRCGGFHPVMPFEFLGDKDRFEVWTKLGQGTFGIVWLCYDHQKSKFCAIKILRDDVSSCREHPSELRINNMLQGVSVEDASDSHVVKPEEHFWQEGPNGKHLCLVMPVMGPSISRTRCYNFHKTDLLKNICFQLVEAMAFLHRHGICHGDFRPSNILFKTTLDGLTPDQMEDYMPNPRAHAIQRLDGVGGEPHAPKFAIEPIFLELEDRYITGDIAIIDFGVSFESSNPPKHVSIPEAWAAPENQIEIDALPGIGSDLWALGITVCETLCGCTPFTCLGEVFSWPMLEEALGPIPEPYRSKLIDHNHCEVRGSTPNLLSPSLNPPQELEMKQAEREERNDTSDFLFDALARRTENLHPDWNDTTKGIVPRMPKGWDCAERTGLDAQEAVEELDVAGLSPERDADSLPTLTFNCDASPSGSMVHQDIAMDSTPQLACITRQLDPAAVPGAVDLIKLVLRWLPEDRVPAEQLLDHAWFEGRNKKKARSASSLPLDKVPTNDVSVPKGQTVCEEAFSDTAPILEQAELTSCKLYMNNVVLAEQEIVVDKGSFPNPSLSQKAEVKAGGDSMSVKSRKEEPSEVGHSLEDESEDREGQHETDTSMGSEASTEHYNVAEDRARRRWRFAIHLLAAGIIIGVGILGQRGNGFCGLGIGVCKTVWKFVHRKSTV